MTKPVFLLPRLLALACIITAIIPAVAEAATPTVSKTGFTLNGHPFFPIISWEQCTGQIGENLQLGVNVFANSCNTTAMDSALQGTGTYQLASIHNPGAGSLSSVAGFIQDDEPDNNGEMPSQMPDTSVAQGKMVWLNTTSHFANEMGDISPAINHQLYPSYWNKADVVGFDLYPLSEFCNETQWVHYDDVYYFQREISQEDGGRPSFQWIEMNQLDMKCGPNPQTPTQVVNEAWLALAGGATSLGYFTWGPVGDGTWTSWQVSPAIASAVSQANKGFQQLAGVLESPVADWSQVMAYANNPVKVGVREYDGHYWLIAVNSSGQNVKASFGVKGAGAGVASVWNESRTVPMKNGSLADSFAPYATHVYQLEPSATQTVNRATTSTAKKVKPAKKATKYK